MDLNMEYAAHQGALMSAAQTTDENDRGAFLLQASLIASRIGMFQQRLGAAASCAWCAAHLAPPANA